MLLLRLLFPVTNVQMAQLSVTKSLPSEFIFASFSVPFPLWLAEEKSLGRSIPPRHRHCSSRQLHKHLFSRCCRFRPPPSHLFSCLLVLCCQDLCNDDEAYLKKRASHESLNRSPKGQRAAVFSCPRRDKNQDDIRSDGVRCAELLRFSCLRPTWNTLASNQKTLNHCAARVPVPRNF